MFFGRPPATAADRRRRFVGKGAERIAVSIFFALQSLEIYWHAWDQIFKYVSVWYNILQETSNL